MRDLYDKIDVRQGNSPVAAQTDNSTISSEIIDMQGWDSMAFVTLIGVNTDADVSFTAVISESDNSDMSASNAVADADLNGTEALLAFDFADDDSVRKIGYHGSKRYVRQVWTPADNAAGDIFLAVVAVMGNPHQEPNAQITS